MEILATIITTTGIPAPAAIVFAFVLGILMFGITMSILDVIACKRGILLAAICGGVVTIFCSALLLFAFPEKEIVQYKVTIDETVSFVEFHKKYEIIDQEGEIYTIQEKENND